MSSRISSGGRAPAWQVWTALGIVYVVWGTTYLAIRVMVDTLPPLLSTAIRFLVAGGAYYMWLRVRKGRAFVSVTTKQFVGAAIVGIALLVGGNGLVTIAEQTVPSGLAALLIASVPLWVVVMRRLTGERVPLATSIGIATGFAGVALLVLPGARPDGASTQGVVLLLIAPVLWAGGSFLAGRIEMPANPFVSTSYQMLAGGLAALLIATARGELGDVRFEELSAASLLALGYLIVVGSWVAFTAYVWVLQNAPISKVATYAYVNPVIALGLGSVLLGEHLTSTMVLAAVVIVASVAAIVRRESGPPPRNPPVEAAPADALVESAG